jgi:transcriptional regulator with GAF, ATPase, and Fis domain
MAKKTSPVNKTVKKNSSKAKGVKTEKPLTKTTSRRNTNGKLKAVSKPSSKKRIQKTTISKSGLVEQQLAQREAELAIINSVQEGLASKLDIQAIYNLVGDKIREIFDAQSVMINYADYDTQLLHLMYVIEDGKRYSPPRPLRADTPVAAALLRTRQPVVLNTIQELESVAFAR